MTAGLRFEERLTGAWSPDETADTGNLGQYLDAAEAGEAAGRELRLELTLATTDVAALADDLGRPMDATGTVAAGGLLAGPAAVRGGSVELVVADDPHDPTVEHMRYHLPLPDANLHLEGFKTLTDGDVTQLWGASTTLHVAIHEGGADGPVVGRGVVRIGPIGFAHQLATLDITEEDGRLEELALLARFGASFFGALWDDYGSVVHRSTPLRRRAAPRRQRPLDLPAREVVGYRSLDGCDLRLTRYRGGRRGPVVLVHGMGANTRTFSLDTIRPNLLEYLTGHGFDVWLQEWRASTALPTAAAQFDCDQVARYDNPAAEAAIRAATGDRDVHWVAHCVSSMTWMMSVLGGWATPASLFLSQIGAHVVVPPLSRVKAGVRAPRLLRRFGVRLLTTDSYDDASRDARVLDHLLRLHPVPRAERCDSAVCRRLAFLYGVAVRHAALDEASHDALHELFGTTNMTTMAHLARCAREGHLVAADGADAYLPHVERAALPITLASGAHNRVFLPESTQRSHDWLADAVGPDLVRRIEFERHGHQDTLMGAEAHREVYPAILAHLERAGC